MTTRTELILVVREADAPGDIATRLKAAIGGGDISAAILVQDRSRDDLSRFQEFAEPLVGLLQQAGIAAIIAGDTRALGRLKADGIHLSGSKEEIEEQVKKAAGRHSVGAEAGLSRHDALEAGEARPDYVFFGSLDGDTHDAAHPANIRFASWWAPIVEIPCVVMGGRTVESVREITATGAEFAALSSAILQAADPGEAVSRALHHLREGQPAETGA